MKYVAMPMNASASVKAIPMYMRTVRRPCSSGWRATDSIVLPTTMPTPIPAPMAERP